MPRLASLTKNLSCFLDLIAWSELGADLLAASDDGYNVIVGSTAASPILFTDYSDHPRKAISIERLHIYSTAAGRYQMIARTWDGCVRNLGLTDFGPENQDRACRLLVQWGHALDLVEQGDIEQAIYNCGGEWASFPNNNYGQGPHKLAQLMARYAQLAQVGGA